MSLNQKPILLQEKQSEDILSHLEKAIEVDKWESVEQMACEFLQALSQRKVDIKGTDIYTHAKKMTKCITWTSRLIDAVRRTSYISETEKKQSQEIAHTPLNISNREAEYYATATAAKEIDYALAKATVISHLSKLRFYLSPFPSSEKHHTVGNMHPKDPLDKPDGVNPYMNRFLSSINLHMYALKTSIRDTKKLIDKAHPQIQTAPSLSNILNMVSKVHDQAGKLANLIQENRPKEQEQKVSSAQWAIWEIWAEIAALAKIILENVTNIKLEAEKLRPHVNNNNMSNNDIVQSIGRIEVLLDEMHKNLLMMGEDTKKMLKK
jgi:hypothetical protein